MKKIIFALSIFVSTIAIAYDEDTASGDAAILKCDTGVTTIKKESCKQSAINKTYIFEGEVSDVTSKHNAEVQITPYNFAKVTFKDDISSFDLRQQIKFQGVLTVFGSGMFTKHEIKDAVLK